VGDGPGGDRGGCGGEGRSRPARAARSRDRARDRPRGADGRARRDPEAGGLLGSPKRRRQVSHGQHPRRSADSARRLVPGPGDVRRPHARGLGRHLRSGSPGPRGPTEELRAGMGLAHREFPAGVLEAVPEAAFGPSGPTRIVEPDGRVASSQAGVERVSVEPFRDSSGAPRPHVRAPRSRRAQREQGRGGHAQHQSMLGASCLNRAFRLLLPTSQGVCQGRRSANTSSALGPAVRST
jgi:hypothetical protein